MIEATPAEAEEQYEEQWLFAGYEDYELNTLTKIYKLIKDYTFALFTVHQAERLMLDVYYYTLKNPASGYSWHDEDETHWVSPTWEEFKQSFYKLVDRHKFHSELENLNAQRRLLGLPEEQPKRPLKLNYE